MAGRSALDHTLAGWGDEPPADGAPPSHGAPAAHAKEPSFDEGEAAQGPGPAAVVTAVVAGTGAGSDSEEEDDDDEGGCCWGPCCSRGAFRKEVLRALKEDTGTDAGGTLGPITDKAAHRRWLAAWDDWMDTDEGVQKEVVRYCDAKTVGFALVAGMVLIVLWAMLIGALFPKAIDREYFIAVEEVEWDYAPKGRNECYDRLFEGEEEKYVLPKGGFVGSKYTKAVFVEYTDKTFSVKKAAAAGFAAQGIVGPAIRAVVGERVAVHLKNNARLAVGLFPQGVQVSKRDEGATYSDGSHAWQQTDDELRGHGLSQTTCEGVDWEKGCKSLFAGVKASESYRYVWDVPDSAGPGAKDGDSVMWLYQGFDKAHPESTHAGLVGPIIITRAGKQTSATDLRPEGVDQEVVVIFSVFDENESPFATQNIRDKVRSRLRAPSLDGQLSFGALDRALVLQALYKHAAASVNGDKLAYEDAKKAIADALQSQMPGYVAAVRGVPVRVWFDKAAFDPVKYDDAYGDGAAEATLDRLSERLFDGGAIFQESNVMHSMNGYVFCNSPKITLQAGRRVRWYVGGVGTEGHADVHPAHWHGNTVTTEQGHVDDVVELLPGSTRAVDMVPDAVGTWLFHCHVHDHVHAGMILTYTVEEPTKGAAERAVKAQVAAGKERHYYLQAEEQEWDYFPAGENKCPGAAKGDFKAAYVTAGPERIGRKYTKARYVAYTDASFTAALTSGEDAVLGVLGPTLRAEVGDTIVLTLRNKASFGVSAHPHGVFYSKEHEGHRYHDGSGDTATPGGDELLPGASFTYRWPVPARSGPTGGLSSRVWTYHSHVQEINDVNTGLVGAIIVTMKGKMKGAQASRLTQANTPTDVDKEYVVLMQTFDENWSRLREKDMLARLSSFKDAKGKDPKTDKKLAARLYRQRKNPAYKKYNKMHAINGRLWCNGAALSAKEGEKVRWHFISLGDVDVHVPAWSAGLHASAPGLASSDTMLLAGSMRTVDMLAAHAGDHELYSAASEYPLAGMRAAFSVQAGTKKAAAAAEGGTTHEHFIAADMVEWEYAPSAFNFCTREGHEAQEWTTEQEKALMLQGPLRVGSKYVKAQYREYTSASFDKLRYGHQSRTNEASAHLGLLGPVLKAQVGDTIKVTFLNRAGFPCNLVPAAPLGVGAGAPGRGPVQPGQSASFTWVVPAAAGPQPADDSSVVWAYGSTVDPVRDTASGLFGAVIVTRAGEDAYDAVQREFVLAFLDLDEGKSHYLERNIQRFAGAPSRVNKQDQGFKDSNQMRSINGRMFCNVPHLDFFLKDTARYYLLGTGTKDGVHGVRWFGHSATQKGHAKATVGLVSGRTTSADVLGKGIGTWMISDSVHRHGAGGQNAKFLVKGKVFRSA